MTARDNVVPMRRYVSAAELRESHLRRALAEADERMYRETRERRRHQLVVLGFLLAIFAASVAGLWMVRP